MTNYSRLGKIIIVIGIVLAIVFTALVIISKIRQTPIVKDDAGVGLLPNPFSGGAGRPARPGTVAPAPILSTDQPGSTLTIVPSDPLVRISDVPITDYRIEPVGRGHTVLFNDRDVGYMYRADDAENPHVTQLSSTLLSSVGDIAFGAAGEIFARYWDTIGYRYEGYFGALIDTLATVKCPITWKTPIKIGATGRDVEILQSYLLRYLSSDVRYTPGVYDATTVDLVKQFQRANKLTPDGVFGPRAATLLMGACDQYARQDAATEFLASGKPRYTVSGIPQVGEMHDVLTSPDGKSLFFIKTTTQGVRGYVRGLDPITPDREIYRIPFVEWTSQWPAAGTIALTTKPAASAAGYLYYLDVATGDLSRKLSRIPGLTTLVAPDTKTVLAGASIQDSYAFSVIQLSDTNVPRVQDAGVRTFPEKCTFQADSTIAYCMVPERLPAGDYPDVWYQGLVSFSDQLWRFDVAGSVRGELLDRFVNDRIPRDFDATHLRLSPDNHYLYFIDDRTNYLWRYDLINRS